MVTRSLNPLCGHAYTLVTGNAMKESEDLHVHGGLTDF